MLKIEFYEKFKREIEAWASGQEVYVYYKDSGRWISMNPDVFSFDYDHIVIKDGFFTARKKHSFGAVMQKRSKASDGDWEDVTSDMQLWVGGFEYREKPKLVDLGTMLVHVAGKILAGKKVTDDDIKGIIEVKDENPAPSRKEMYEAIRPQIRRTELGHVIYLKDMAQIDQITGEVILLQSNTSYPVAVKNLTHSNFSLRDSTKYAGIIEPEWYETVMAWEKGKRCAAIFMTDDLKKKYNPSYNFAVVKQDSGKWVTPSFGPMFSSKNEYRVINKRHAKLYEDYLAGRPIYEFAGEIGYIKTDFVGDYDEGISYINEFEYDRYINSRGLCPQCDQKDKITDEGICAYCVDLNKRVDAQNGAA